MNKLVLTINARIHVLVVVVTTQNVELSPIQFLVHVLTATQEIHSYNVLFKIFSQSILVNLRHVDQMLNVKREMRLEHAYVSKIISVIHTKVADPNVCSVQIAQPIKLVLGTNA